MEISFSEDFARQSAEFTFEGCEHDPLIFEMMYDLNSWIFTTITDAAMLVEKHYLNNWIF